MSKRLMLMLIVIFSVFAFAGTALAASGQVTLNYNGKNLPSDVPPVIKSGRTLVPVRVISEALGADVNWDSTLQEITITKNDKVIKLMINNKQVLQNGQKLTDLDVPAQIVSGRTVVPVRFVSEALGAEVGWDDKTQTVSVTFEEKRDGMTPEELMLKSNEAMTQKNSYKFKGTADMVVNMEGQAPVKTKLEMEGIYKKTGNRAEVYVKQAVYVPSLDGVPPVAVNMETYTDGGTIYQKMGTGSWQKQQLTGDIASMFQNQDPQKALQMIEDFGLIIAHGNEAMVDNKQYYTLFVKIDGEKFKSFMKNVLSQVSGDVAGGEIDKDEFAKLMDELVSGMSLDLTEKIFINKETFVADKTLMDGKISFSTGGITMTQDIKMDMEIYDLGAEVSMPDIDLQ